MVRVKETQLEKVNQVWFTLQKSFTLKSNEMFDLFSDIPEVFSVCKEIYEKIQDFDLRKKNYHYHFYDILKNF